MDNSLMQLERELFSLTPVEPGRPLAAHLERMVCTPVQIQRRVPHSSGVLPFQWKRVVVPAAAAVAVVAVLSSTEGSRSVGYASASGLAAGSVDGEGEFNHGTAPLYAAKAHPISVRPGFNREQVPVQSVYMAPVNNKASSFEEFDGRGVEHYMWFNPETNSYIQLSVPRRVVQPAVKFH